MKVLLSVLAFCMLAPVTNAQTTGQAETFVRHLYSAYEHPASSSGPDYLAKDAPLVFSPSLLSLIRLDQKNTPPGYVGKLDFDPLCYCQDSEA
jgi:hypothetical protein